MPSFILAFSLLGLFCALFAAENPYIFKADALSTISEIKIQANI
jgi:hypothetical protein